MNMKIYTIYYTPYELFWLFWLFWLFSTRLIKLLGTYLVALGVFVADSICDIDSKQNKNSLVVHQKELVGLGLRIFPG